MHLDEYSPLALSFRKAQFATIKTYACGHTFIDPDISETDFRHELYRLYTIRHYVINGGVFKAGFSLNEKNYADE
jgi:hypothetical protein